MEYKYKVVDVFTSKPLKGNPVAVVLDGSQLSDAQMQDIARWTNLSETTFVVPATEPNADYHVRIFDPKSELPFAGHPSLGTAHALLESKIVERKHRLVQQCKRGLINMNVTGSRVEFGLQINEHQVLNAAETTAVSEALHGLELSEKPPMIVYAGPLWIVVETKATSAELLEYKPDFSTIESVSRQLDASGICVFARHDDSQESIEVRTFAPSVGVNEDPVCGSGQAAVAYYRDLGADYTAKQGSAIHRDGEARVRCERGMVWVSGECVTVADGHLRI